MPSTSLLPDAPGPDDFRALALSSPWRFGTLHFTHRAEGEDPVEAWLRRPGHLEVLTRGERHEETGVPYTRSALYLPEPPLAPGAGAEPGLAPRTEVGETVPFPRVTPQSVEPVRRPDGLVAVRPDAIEIEYDDPMWQNYRWVAMLDPVELSHGVEVSEVQVRERFGRATWTASVRALRESSEGAGDGYDPRCSCCPLLFGEVSQELEFGGQRPRARWRRPVTPRHTGCPSTWRPAWSSTSSRRTVTGHARPSQTRSMRSGHWSPDQPVSGLTHRTSGNRAKSVSAETSSTPNSVASAARWASGTRFPVMWWRTARSR